MLKFWKIKKKEGKESMNHKQDFKQRIDLRINLWTNQIEIIRVTNIIVKIKTKWSKTKTIFVNNISNKETKT